MRYRVTGTQANGIPQAFDTEAPDAANASSQAAARGLKDLTVSPLPAEPAPITLNYQTPPDTGINLRNRWRVVGIFLGAESLGGLGLLAMGFFNMGSSDGTRLLAWASIGLLYIVLQLGVMVPVLRPRATATQPRAAWRWLSALALGVLLGSLIFSGLLLAADLIWATNTNVDDHFLEQMVYAALFVTLALWLISVPLIFAFMRKRPPESALARLSASLFLGSVVEFIAGIPILALAQKRDDCTCAHASFWSMVLAALNATLVLGPMVFLIILARRTRAVSRGRCAACGFDLRPFASKDQCPNCGAGWKPAS